REIPSELFRPAPIATSAPSPAAQVPDSLNAAGNAYQIVMPPANASQVESLIQQQLNIMQQQISLLRGGANRNTMEADVLNLKDLANLNGQQNQSQEKKDLPNQEETQITRSTKGVTAKMSNYQKISGGEGLTERQKQGLHGFIQRYNVMT